MTLARNADPETSREAADSLTDLGRYRALVLTMLREAGASTDEELVTLFLTLLRTGTPSGVRTRRSELTRMGLVRWTGEHRIGHTGRRARLWAAVPVVEDES